MPPYRINERYDCRSNGLRHVRHQSSLVVARTGSVEFQSAGYVLFNMDRFNRGNRCLANYGGGIDKYSLADHA